MQAGAGYARTDASGHYDLAVPAGSYTVSALDFAGYQTQSGVAVAAGQSVTQNFALTAAPDVTLSGTVKDGSGQGWPLCAKITLAGLPVSAYTSPVTGRYSLRVPPGSTLTVQASPLYPGYQPQAQQTVSTGIGNATQNFTVPISWGSWLHRARLPRRRRAQPVADVQQDHDPGPLESPEDQPVHHLAVRRPRRAA